MTAKSTSFFLGIEMWVLQLLAEATRKASGLVLLKSDILMLESLSSELRFSHENSNWVLNSSKATDRDEYAFRPTERKTQFKGDSK